MCSHARLRARRLGTLDGLKVRVIDDCAASDAELARALRTLARMMVRSYEADGDHEASVGQLGSSSPLTLAPIPRTDHTDEAA